MKAHEISNSDRIFPISYVAAWSMIKKSGNLVNIELRPHDLRRHAVTYTLRSGTPIEIVSKVILNNKKGRAIYWADEFNLLIMPP